MSQYAANFMPQKAPLPMADQAFARAPNTPDRVRPSSITERAWRFAAFGPAILMTLTLCWGIGRALAEGGITALEVFVVTLVGITFIWVSLTVSTVTLGLIRRLLASCQPRHSPGRSGPQNIALLVPIYSEAPADVFGNAAAMLKELASGPQHDAFTLFLLSDTQNDALAAEEERAFFALQSQLAGRIAVHYRRRAANVDKKVGNLTDWIEHWGAGYDAMLVLDADSLMSGAAIRYLAHELAADPDAGLIQSFPSLIGAETLFGRVQQFSNAVYGWLLAEGLAVWSQREGNYWGHNAIIRTQAFAESAQLPKLGGRDLILSHDFVEAGMLRRAGWGVRFLPRTGGSFEETPQNLIDYAIRDRRWCQGNLQHLRLLAARGFHPVSRFHLLQGALAFLMSPAWLALIVAWTWLGATRGAEPVTYFTASNPLYPVWPMASALDGWFYLAVIYSMLLMPKVAGAIALGFRARIRADYGGWLRYLSTALTEIIWSIIFAPILLVQQTKAVLYALLGKCHIPEGSMAVS